MTVGPSVIQGLQHPAVVLSDDGRLLAGNIEGEAAYTQTLEADDLPDEGWVPGKPFQKMTLHGELLKATPLRDQAATLLEWLPLSHSETRLALFQAVSRSVNSSLVLEEIFDALGEVLQTFIPFEAGTLVILDESQNSTKVVVFFDEQGQAELRGDNNLFAGYDPLIDTLVKKPQSHCLSAPFPSSLLTRLEAEKTLIVPLVSKGLVIGGMSLIGSGYSEVHVQLLEDVTEQLAVAVENARLYWQTQSQAGREFLINHITKAIRQSLDIQQILETTVREVGKVLGLSRCLIHYWGESADTFDYFEYVSPGVAPLTQPETFSGFERDLFQKRLESSQKYNPFILNDSRGFTMQTALLEEAQIKSLAVFPILLQETAFVGTISLHQCETYRAWLSEEIDLLKAIAEHVAVALHQADLFQDKERQRKQLEDALNELRQTQMQLIQSEKMAVLGQFVAGIAHEVNTPLGTLMSNDDTIRLCVETLQASDDKQAKYRATALELLKINHMAGERIQEIVRNLRNFARLDESDLKQVDLHEGLDATLLLMRSTYKNKAQIVKQYGDLPSVECFPGLLNQVFMNLLINACHSLDTMGTITITTRFEQDQVHVAITDTGKGIAPEHLPRIFDPGFTTKGVGVGTGLGLALCYKIMEKHHGEIRVESIMNQGTTMTVVLPVTQPISRT